jgi:CheY-like chemotaxis protein
MAAVLLVEDDADTREVVCSLLEQEGYEPVGAANGKEAIEYLGNCEQLPCLVLLDLHMPGMSGREVLCWMRADSRCAGVPVALLTATSRSAAEDVASKFRDHVIEVLQKPFDIDHVLNLIDAHCEAPQPAA